MLFIPIPLPELAVLLPIFGGGAMLKELLPAGLSGGGAMLKDEYMLLGCWTCVGAGASAEKLDSPLVACDADDVLPHAFDAIEGPDALLQSIPEVCVLVYDGVVVGDIMLFMLVAGLDCCWGGANDGLPMPGLTAFRAGKEEFNVLKVLSGVTVRLCVVGTERLV